MSALYVRHSVAALALVLALTPTTSALPTSSLHARLYVTNEDDGTYRLNISAIVGITVTLAVVILLIVSYAIYRRSVRKREARRKVSWPHRAMSMDHNAGYVVYPSNSRLSEPLPVYRP